MKLDDQWSFYLGEIIGRREELRGRRAIHDESLRTQLLISRPTKPTHSLTHLLTTHHRMRRRRMKTHSQYAEADRYTLRNRYCPPTGTPAPVIHPKHLSW